MMSAIYNIPRMVASALLIVAALAATVLFLAGGLAVAKASDWLVGRVGT